VEEAAVIEVVDHHRIGDVQTTGPILFLNIPVGATATVVALRYEELGVVVPESMAGYPARGRAHGYRAAEVADDHRDRP
jgi:inorganic pyrophosphatase/exopolyphosphatase